MPRDLRNKRLWEQANLHTASCRLPYHIWATFAMRCAKNGTCPNRVLTAAVMAYIAETGKRPAPPASAVIVPFKQ